MKQTILVTRASSGFTLLIASELHKSGYSAIGTSGNRFENSILKNLNKL